MPNNHRATPPSAAPIPTASAWPSIITVRPPYSGTYWRPFVLYLGVLPAIVPDKRCLAIQDLHALRQTGKPLQVLGHRGDLSGGLAEGFRELDWQRRFKHQHGDAHVGLLEGYLDRGGRVRVDKDASVVLNR